MDAATVIAFLVAAGFFTAAAEGFRWLLSRRATHDKAKLDSAQVVQGMALELLAPLHKELDAANKQVSDLRAQLHALETEVDDWVRWARAAKRLLDGAGLAVAPMPERRYV